MFTMDAGIVATVEKATLHPVFYALQAVCLHVVPECAEHMHIALPSFAAHMIVIGFATKLLIASRGKYDF